MTPATLGQFFTPEHIVVKMLRLRRLTGFVLEPSCGDGAFARHLRGRYLRAIELDSQVCPKYARNMDFFDYDGDGIEFDTIIGNPPYVRGQDILPSTRAKLSSEGFGRGANLYLHFIRKCVQHLNPRGELIFVVPREFATATSARHLHSWMWERGHYTHFEDIGDTQFGSANLPCVVFRWVLSPARINRKLADGRYMHLSSGRLCFSSVVGAVPLSDYFTVRVGGVSGLDSVFTSKRGNVRVVCSSTRMTGRTRRMLVGNAAKREISQYPKLVGMLKDRRIRNFDDSNWWQWGRGWHESESPRIYVNCKTRNDKPFFTHDCTAYDGSVLALFPTSLDVDLVAWCQHLNAQDWSALGFKSSGRYLFSAGALQACHLPPLVIG